MKNEKASSARRREFKSWSGSVLLAASMLMMTGPASAQIAPPPAAPPPAAPPPPAPPAPGADDAAAAALLVQANAESQRKRYDEADRLVKQAIRLTNLSSDRRAEVQRAAHELAISRALERSAAAELRGDPKAARDLLRKVAASIDVNNVSSESLIKLETKLDELEAELNPGCDGSNFCFVGGVFLASYSMAAFGSPRDGETAHQLVSIVLPSIGFRWSAHPAVSVDFLGYTSLLDTNLKSTNFDRKNSGCRPGENSFEDRLPCEGDALMRPYGALALLATVSSGTDFGLVAPGVTGGFARTTQEPTPGFYFGFMVATGGLFKTIGID